MNLGYESVVEGNPVARMSLMSVTCDAGGISIETCSPMSENVSVSENDVGCVGSSASSDRHAGAAPESC